MTDDQYAARESNAALGGAPLRGALESRAASGGAREIRKAQLRALESSTFRSRGARESREAQLCALESKAAQSKPSALSRSLTRPIFDVARVPELVRRAYSSAEKTRLSVEAASGNDIHKSSRSPFKSVGCFTRMGDFTRFLGKSAISPLATASSVSVYVCQCDTIVSAGCTLVQVKHVKNTFVDFDICHRMASM